MFSLIITVISVALVAALAIATAYYGGDVFETRKAQSDANRYLNETQQIVGAINLYRAEGNGKPDSFAEMTPEYLDSIPEAAESWNLSAGEIQRTVTEAATCKQVNITAGLPEEFITDTPRSCSDFEEANLSSQYYCCDDA